MRYLVIYLGSRKRAQEIGIGNGDLWLGRFVVWLHEFIHVFVFLLPITATYIAELELVTQLAYPEKVSNNKPWLWYASLRTILFFPPKCVSRPPFRNVYFYYPIDWH